VPTIVADQASYYKGGDFRRLVDELRWHLTLCTPHSHATHGIAERANRTLLDHARAHGKDPWVVDRAARLLLQPGDSLPHDDHFHVRLACTLRERALGCVDGAPLWPWMIKDWEKGDALPNDDDAVLDLMEPLTAGTLHGPPDPTRAAAQVCAPPKVVSAVPDFEALVCR
jgi:penicillin-insensitive murein endopeptidase